MTDAPKPVGDAEVLIGLPSRNPYSLPFAHRKLFASRLQEHDLFVYSEDDTLITAVQLNAFIELQRYLREDEILGFLRSETAPDGERYITSINHFFRWIPESAERRGDEIFAEFSNRHSGCFVATRNQLARAIESGGFLVEPHQEMYGMLESAASDIYTQCGLRRLVCISRVDEFIVPHLPNKYFSTMGIPIGELRRQITALETIADDESLPVALLVQPQTRAYRFRWSKHLYEPTNQAVVDVLPSGTRRVLSVGVGLGHTEQALVQKGVEVHAIAVDAVFANVLQSRGIPSVCGALEQTLVAVDREPFDAILVTDVLHLVAEPALWLRRLMEHLGVDGSMIIVSPSTCAVRPWLKDVRDGLIRSPIPRFDSSGVHAVTPGRVRRLCRSAGLRVCEVRTAEDGAGVSVSATLGHRLLSGRPFLIRATRV